MRFYILYFFIIIFNNQTIYAKTHIVEGYYIDLNDKKIEVSFEIKTYEEDSKVSIADIQERIIVIENNKKFKLWPYMAKEISFNFNDKNYILYSKCLECLCLACPDTLQNNFFLIKKIAGIVSLYSIEETSSGKGVGADLIARTSLNNNPIKRELTYILQKNNDKLIFLNLYDEKLYFLNLHIVSTEYKAELLKYFSDCSIALDMIKSKDFIYLKIPELVNLYNSNCK
jgi:hypothetical protein